MQMDREPNKLAHTTNNITGEYLLHLYVMLFYILIIRINIEGKLILWEM